MALGLAGWLYGGVALLASLGLAGFALTGLGRRGESPRWARDVFLATLLYLTLLMAALFVGARP